MVENFKARIQISRINCQMGAAGIKMNDKFWIILGFETSNNDVSKGK